MMIKKIITVLLPCFVIANLSIASAKPSHEQIRRCYSKVFSVLREYELTADFVTDSAPGDFIRLFGGNHQAPVYMDLMGSESFGKNITVEEYVRFVSDNGYMLQYRVSNVRKGVLREEGEWLILPLSFTKTVTYFDNNEVYFSPESFYGSPVRLTAEFAYNTRTGDCFIRSVDGHLESRRPVLSGHYTVILTHKEHPKKSRLDSLLLKNNGGPSFDDHGQVFYSGDVSGFQTWDPDIRISKELIPLNEQGQYDLIRFNYTPVKFRTQFRVGFAPVAYAATSPNELSCCSFAFEPSLHIGYAFKLGDIKLVPTVGVGVSFSGLQLKKKGVDYVDPLSQRHYSIDRASVWLSFTDVVVPAGLDGEYRMNENWLAHAHIGVKYYLNKRSRIAPCIIDGAIDEEPFHLEADHYLYPVEFERTPSDFCFTGGAGADYNLMKNRVFARFGISYERAVKPSYSKEEGPMMQVDEGIYPLSFDASAQIDLPTAPMFGSLSFTRSTLWVYAGVVAKF